MTVYVDDMRAAFGRLVMCHMIADTTYELVTVAEALGVRSKWLQKAGGPDEHFDIALAKRALAVRLGATEITWRECGCMTLRRRATGQLGRPGDAVEWARAFRRTVVE